MTLILVGLGCVVVGFALGLLYGDDLSRQFSKFTDWLNKQ